MFSRDAVAFRRLLNAMHISLLHPVGAIDPATAFAQFLKVVASAILVDQAEARALAADSPQPQPVSLHVEAKFVSQEPAPQDVGIIGSLSAANTFPVFTENAAPIIRVRDAPPIRFDTVRANSFLASIPWMGAIPVAPAQAPTQSTAAWDASPFNVSEFLAAAYFSAMPWDTAHPQKIQVGPSRGQSHARLAAGRDILIGQTATLQAIRASRGTPSLSVEFFGAVPWKKSPSPQIGATA